MSDAELIQKLETEQIQTSEADSRQASSSTFTFYTLPNNNANSASIPIPTTTQPIAIANATVNTGSRVILRGTVGWEAQTLGIRGVEVLFRIWRGAPITGTLINSALDSGDVDREIPTLFTHVDTGFTGPQSITYVLTAELTDPVTSARIIGPLTFTASVY